MSLIRSQIVYRFYVVIQVFLLHGIVSILIIPDLPVHKTEDGLHTDVLVGVVLVLLACVAADQKVEGDDEPHRLEDGQDRPGHGDPALGPCGHLPGTAGSVKSTSRKILFDE